MRPLAVITVGYITGIIWGLYLNISIVPVFFLLIGIFILFNWFGGERLRKFIQKANSKKFYIISFIVFAIISNAQIIYLENKHENLYKGKAEVEIVGTIISDREETTYKAKYTIKVESVDGNAEFKGTYLLIYVAKEQELEYGDKIILKGEYEEASFATNYKAFDYKEYLKCKNIYRDSECK